MASAAALTPLSVGIVRSTLDAMAFVTYAVFLAIVLCTLLFHEVADRRLRARFGAQSGRDTDTDAPAGSPTGGSMGTARTDDRPVGSFFIAEAAALIVLSGILAWIAGTIWLLAILVIPAVLLNVRIRKRGWPVPFGGELTGVGALSIVVPAGGVLAGISGFHEILLLWALFTAFHLGSVIRVGMVLATDGGIVKRAHVIGGLSYHALTVVVLTGIWAVATVGTISPVVGIAAPIVFAAAFVRSLQSASMRGRSVEFKTLGRAEGVLSFFFVLGAPWMI